MQCPFEPHEGEEFESPDPADNQHVDFAALRVLAAWIAQRTGMDPEIRATIDRGFVVAQAHA